MIYIKMSCYFLTIAAITIMIDSCTPAPRFRDSSTKKHYVKKAKRSQAHFKTGQVLKGKASWYGPKFHGKKTANGETYDMYGITAAHKELPFNTIVEVTNMVNGKKCRVRINDRGPFIKNRILDLSKGAAQKIGLDKMGVAKVEIRIISLGDK